MEHTVIVDTFGGTTVLSCIVLNIQNIEYPFKELDVQGIKKTILDYKYLKEEDANFDLIVIDNRPEPENFNEQRDKESKDFTKNRNELIAKRLGK